MSTDRPTDGLGGGPEVGLVAAFDARRGLGSVQPATGGAVLGFHATAITDGSRSVALGARVAFVRRPGHGGAVEAAHLAVLADTDAADPTAITTA